MLYQGHEGMADEGQEAGIGDDPSPCNSRPAAFIAYSSTGRQPPYNHSGGFSLIIGSRQNYFIILSPLNKNRK